MFPRGTAEGNIEIPGKQKKLFPEGQSLSDLSYANNRYLIPLNAKSRKRVIVSWNVCTV